MSKNIEPKLAKPGAGLPFFELLLTRYWILPRMSSSMSWEEAHQMFLSEGEKILKLIEPISLENMDRKILIPHVKGLEDSSRYWSIAMTLEHLMIIGDLFALIVEDLGRHKEVKSNLTLADVKPRALLAAGDAKNTFRDFLPKITKRVMAPDLDRDSPNTATHPWFSKINVRKWNWLLGSHQWIHRQQIKEILKRL